ncbi:ribonuclease P subunit [Brachionus plicatilis]|uniref:Ribonuclease P subunit n=1 Tax=Brachionus plicatilis TaxID=10195 RepID=A0A3M7T665_BRAPC|nr:ribonuclease P subunit [Brachionus plicatilis]
MSDLFKDTFCHQVDIIVPNKERVFDKIKNLFSRYYFLSKVSLSELLSDDFIDKFYKNGDLYLYSLNTKLDCETCACLIPSGKLILNVSKSLNERIPINFSKKSVKFTGFEKYEIEFSIKELRKTKDFDLLKKVLGQVTLSFYAYWSTKDIDVDSEKEFKDFFGSKRVFNCLNRIDCQVKTCPGELIDKILLKNLIKGKDWIDAENLLGCLINNIDLKNFFANIDTENRKISFLRIKGFIPNRIVKNIIQNYLKPLIVDDVQQVERIILKVHGFRDSPLTLVKLDSSLEKKMRTNEENFVGIFLEYDQNRSSYDAVYKDFKNIFTISTNK